MNQEVLHPICAAFRMYRRSLIPPRQALNLARKAVAFHAQTRPAFVGKPLGRVLVFQA